MLRGLGFVRSATLRLAELKGRIRTSLEVG